MKRMNVCFKMAKILSGLEVASKIQHNVKNEITRILASGARCPHFVTIIVGNDAASEIYVSKKQQAAQQIGINGQVIRFSDSIVQSQIVDEITKLNADETIDGIMVQRPLPAHISELSVLNAVHPNKDIDGFHYENIGKMFQDDVYGLLPCTSVAVIEILEHYKVNMYGKHVVICGRSKSVGLPLACMLQADGRKSSLAQDATITVCNRFTPPELLRQMVSLGDVVISATGVAHLIKSDFVKPGACVVDVGISRKIDANGRSVIVGDVDFDNVSKVASQITPMPGGVGPVTVAVLMSNVMKAYKLNQNKH